MWEVDRILDFGKNKVEYLIKFLVMVLSTICGRMT